VVAVVTVALTLLAMGVIVANRKEAAPAVYRVSADLLIPAIDLDTGDRPAGVPIVLLYGQLQMALEAQSAALGVEAGAPPSPDVGAAPSSDVVLRSVLNEDRDIVTLGVDAPDAPRANAVLQSWVQAYSDARLEAGLHEMEGVRDAQLAAIVVLDKHLSEVLAQLGPFPLPPMVPAGDAVPIPEGTPPEVELLLYDRNSLLNQIVSRQIDYAARNTQTFIPDDYASVVVQRPAIPISTPPPSPTGPLVLIGIVGLLAAVAAPILLDRFDTSLSDAGRTASALRARVLATIPAIPRSEQRGLVPRGSALDGAFRVLAATSISTDRLPKSILVTAPKGSIQNVVAANFAAALARLGITAVLIGTVAGDDWDLGPGRPGDEPVGARDAGEAAEPGPTAGESEEGATDAPRPESAGGPPSAPASHPTFPQLLDDAHQGRLVDGVRARLATTSVPNLYVVPPGGEDAPLPLDGLPPLLDALARDGVDITVIAGPALLENSNATIIAWATRSVLWAVELGRLQGRDAQLAADRLELAGVEPFGVAVVDRGR
jgi:hypothetical protein